MTHYSLPTTTRLSIADVQAIEQRMYAYNTEEGVTLNRIEIASLIKELRLTVAERDTYRIERDEALAREALLLAEIRAHHEARGLLEDA